MRNHWAEIEKYLEDQKIAQELIGELRDFHMRYEVEDQVKERVEKPDILFYGKKILEMSIAALLQGDNLLLSGAKATGKNVLCETLAWIFGRPEYDISFHVNTDSADLIGTDTFINNEVRLRKGSIYQCAEFGGFGILDEINMAKNDAVSVLHATLDHRRRIDIPGYNRILLHPATRFIGTMNYGYAGTRDLNEALVSRFMVIDMPEMEEAAERVIMGPERRSRVISDKEKRLTAYHEGGHTLVGMLLDNTDPVHKVTIIPRGRAGGYTLSLPKEDRYYATRSEMLDELKVLLGGRVAEALVLKEISSGASNDLQRATQLARQMICEYGMSENIGPVTFGHRQDQVFLGRDIARDKDYSEEVAAEIDKEVRSFMEDAYAATEKLLSDNIDKLHVIAKALMEKETLEEEEINQLVKYGHILTAEEKLQLVQQSVVDEEATAAPIAEADAKAEAPAAEAGVSEAAANAGEEALKE